MVTFAEEIVVAGGSCARTHTPPSTLLHMWRRKHHSLPRKARLDWSRLAMPAWSSVSCSQLSFVQAANIASRYNWKDTRGVFKGHCKQGAADLFAKEDKLIWLAATRCPLKVIESLDPTTLKNSEELSIWYLIWDGGRDSLLPYSAIFYYSFWFLYLSAKLHRGGRFPFCFNLMFECCRKIIQLNIWFNIVYTKFNSNYYSIQNKFCWFNSKDNSIQ